MKGVYHILDADLALGVLALSLLVDEVLEGVEICGGRGGGADRRISKSIGFGLSISRKREGKSEARPGNEPKSMRYVRSTCS
jgi:hypothetical protein